MGADYRINVKDNVEMVVFICNAVMKQQTRESLPGPTKLVLKWVASGRIKVSSDNLRLMQMATDVLQWLNC
jgi:hypothetical protein